MDFIWLLGASTCLATNSCCPRMRQPGNLRSETSSERGQEMQIAESRVRLQMEMKHWELSVALFPLRWEPALPW